MGGRTMGGFEGAGRRGAGGLSPRKGSTKRAASAATSGSDDVVWRLEACGVSCAAWVFSGCTLR
jgi:hypothetical protein